MKASKLSAHDERMGELEADEGLEQHIAENFPAIRSRIDSDEPAPEATSDDPSEEEHYFALLAFGKCPWCGQSA